MNVLLLIYCFIILLINHYECKQTSSNNKIDDQTANTEILRSNERCLTNCGENIYFTRIVNGTEVKNFEYPWMVAVFHRKKFTCGATVINDLYVLTAAHCATGKKNDYYLIFGLNKISKSNLKSNQIYGLDKIIKHNFNWYSFQNDVALMKLNRKIEQFSDKVRPIRLPLYRNEKYYNRKAIVSGWGYLDPHYEKVSDSLREVTLPIISNSECARLYKNVNDIYETQICSMFNGQTPKDACKGDSGGPLMFKRENYYELIGVVSWGDGCAKRGNPGVFTRVTSYLNWIYNNTLDACRCSQIS